MKSLKDFNYLLSLDRRYTKTESEIFRLKAKYRRNMPNPVPTILLGRLAVDKKYAGRGLGKSMLLAAIRASIEIAKSIGVAAVVVHPISEEAEHFYLKNGFAYAREGNPMLLFALGPFVSSK